MFNHVYCKSAIFEVRMDVFFFFFFFSFLLFLFYFFIFIFFTYFGMYGNTRPVAIRWYQHDQLDVSGGGGGSVFNFTGCGNHPLGNHVADKVLVRQGLNAIT